MEELLKGGDYTGLALLCEQQELEVRVTILICTLVA